MRVVAATYKLWMALLQNMVQGAQNYDLQASTCSALLLLCISNSEHLPTELDLKLRGRMGGSAVILY